MPQPWRIAKPYLHQVVVQDARGNFQLLPVTAFQSVPAEHELENVPVPRHLAKDWLGLKAMSQSCRI